MKLSPIQLAILERLWATAEAKIPAKITPEGGGYWRIGHTRVESANTTQVVYALARKGFLRQAGDGPPWRSEYLLTPDGLRAFEATTNEVIVRGRGGRP